LPEVVVIGGFGRPRRTPFAGTDRLLEDVSAGAWFGRPLQGWGVVGGVVPRGFPAVARVLHPIDRSRLRGIEPDGLLDVEHAPVRWREVEEPFGRMAHPTMQWGSRDEQVPWDDR
jgi:hypothetical protein